LKWKEKADIWIINVLLTTHSIPVPTTGKDTLVAQMNLFLVLGFGLHSTRRLHRLRLFCRNQGY